jgi:predicted RNA-binding Zn-ribbon protein involved in translation (DUF1610 family)
MTIYRLAVRHAQLMLFATLAAFMFVITIDKWMGHSTWAFAVAVLMLIAFNARIRLFNCPYCGKNLFFRGAIIFPWPSKTCSQCGADLDAS